MDSVIKSHPMDALRGLTNKQEMVVQINVN